MSVAPHSPVAPQGGLRQHENAGGHTLNPDKAHVGASDQQLIDRLAQDPKMKNGASSYYDRQSAERAAHENIRGNEDAIRRWLNESERPTQRFDWQHEQQVGRHAPPGTARVDDVTDVHGSRVVLRRDPSMPDGYHILTTFPRL